MFAGVDPGLWGLPCRLSAVGYRPPQSTAMRYTPSCSYPRSSISSSQGPTVINQRARSPLSRSRLRLPISPALGPPCKGKGATRRNPLHSARAGVGARGEPAVSLGPDGPGGCQGVGERGVGGGLGAQGMWTCPPHIVPRGSFGQPLDAIFRAEYRTVRVGKRRAVRERRGGEGRGWLRRGADPEEGGRRANSGLNIT